MGAPAIPQAHKVFDGTWAARAGANGVDATGDNSPTRQYATGFRSWYTYVQGGSGVVHEGVGLFVAGDENANTTAWHVRALHGAYDYSSSGTWSDTLEVEIQIDCKIYATDTPNWQVEVSEVRAYKNGSLVDTDTTDRTLLSTGLAPTFLPFFGTPPVIYASTTLSSTGSGLGDEWTVSVANTVPYYGGYRFKRTGDSGWTEPPVTIQTPTYEGCWSDCHWCLSGPTIPTGTTTWNVAAQLYEYAEYEKAIYRPIGGGTPVEWFRTNTRSNSVGYFIVQPDVEKQLVREPDDDYYQMLVQRGAFPQAVAYSARYCRVQGTLQNPWDSGNTHDDLVEIHPAKSSYLGIIQKNPGELEYPFSVSTPVFWTGSRTQSEGQWVGFFDRPDILDAPTLPYDNKGPGEGVLWKGFENVQCRTMTNAAPQSASPYMLAYLGLEGYSGANYEPFVPEGTITVNPSVAYDYICPLFRYADFWGSPYWSYFIKDRNWEVDLVATSWEDYWRVLGQQYGWHPDLDGEQDTFYRNDVISAPLAEGGNNSFIETIAFGSKTSWLGEWNWQYETPAPSSTLQLDSTSSGRWTFKDVGDSDVTATFAGGYIDIPDTAVTIKLLLPSWTEPGYMYPAVADAFKFSWNDTYVDTCRVYLVGVDGHEVLLCDDTKDTWITWAGIESSLASTDYAGTWAADYGVGEVTDTGSDDLGNGDSPAMMASGTRILASQLLKGRTAKYLRFEFTLQAGQTHARISYPDFKAPTTIPTLYHLGRQYTACLWPNGPGLVLGGSSFWDYLTDTYTATPSALPPGQKSTVLDALSLSRAIAGVAPTSGLDAALDGLYDEVEMPRSVSRRWQSAYWTYTVPVISEDKLKFAMFSSYQVPTSWWQSHTERDADLLPVDETSSGEAWSWAQNCRYLINPSTQASELRTPTGTVWTSNVWSGSGWEVQRYRHIVDNTESGFGIWLDTDKYAMVRPWHGWLWIWGVPAPTTTSGLWLFKDAYGNRYVTSIAGGGVKLERSSSDVGLNTWNQNVQVTTDATDNEPKGVVSVEGRLYLCWERAGTIYLAISDDEGQTFDTSTMGSGLKPVPVSDEWGQVALAWFEYNSGSSGPGRVKIKVKPADSDSFGSTITVPVDIEDTGFGLTCPVHSESPALLAVVKSGESDRTIYKSTDNFATWEEI